MSLLILDTNILLYLRGDKRDNRTKKAENILFSIKKGINEGIMPAPILMELYYKITESDSESNAKAHIYTLLKIPNILKNCKKYPITHEIGIFAGFLYYKYNTSKKSYYQTHINEKPPSAVDCLIASMGKYIPNSIICTNDKRITEIEEINAKRFYEIKT